MSRLPARQPRAAGGRAAHRVFPARDQDAGVEDYVRSLRDGLERAGKRTGVFRIHTPLPMMCLWTEGQRRRLRKRARGYDAVLVLGCDSATHTVKDALRDAGCRVFQSMRMTGLSNATAKFGWPLKIELKHGTDVPVA